MPKFGDLKRYCERSGWELFKTTDHYWHRKILDDGSILVTKVSMSPGKEIPRRMWNYILKRQLLVTQEEFNRGI